MNLRKGTQEADEKLVSVSLRASETIAALEARNSTLQMLLRDAEARAKSAEHQLLSVEARAEAAEVRARRATEWLIRLHDVVTKAFSDVDPISPRATLK